MPKRLSKTRKSFDPNVSAFRVLQQITGEAAPPKKNNIVQMKPAKNPAAVALGRRGGIASAAVRKQRIPETERVRIATHAARTRWKREKGDG